MSGDVTVTYSQATQCQHRYNCRLHTDSTQWCGWKRIEERQITRLTGRSFRLGNNCARQTPVFFELPAYVARSNRCDVKLVVRHVNLAHGREQAARRRNAGTELDVSEDEATRVTFRAAPVALSGEENARLHCLFWKIRTY